MARRPPPPCSVCNANLALRTSFARHIVRVAGVAVCDAPCCETGGCLDNHIAQCAPLKDAAEQLRAAMSQRNTII
jgi:hypothetical protein